MPIPLPPGRRFRLLVLIALVAVLTPLMLALAAELKANEPTVTAPLPSASRRAPSPSPSPSRPPSPSPSPSPTDPGRTDRQFEDGTARAVFTVPERQTSEISFAVALRHQPDGSGYEAQAVVDPDRQVTVRLQRWDYGQRVELASEVLETKAVPGRALSVEGAVTGSDAVVLRVRAWVDGKAPGWQQSTVDRSPWRVTGEGSTKPEASSTETGSSSPAAVVQRFSAAGKPSASTTGVPDGTKLRVHRGNIVVRKAGTHLDGLDVRGFVIVEAENVRITRSIIRGGKGPKTAVGLITNYGYPGLVISDVRLKPAYRSVYVDGIKGWNFTARRVHVSGNVDSVKVQGDNVRIESSLLEDTTWFPHDPYQGGGPTHNDNVQVLEGRNILITGNTMRGSQNFAVLGGARQGDVAVQVSDNWLDGGHCTVKLESFGKHQLTATLATNTFGPHRAVSYCLIQATTSVSYEVKGNVSSTDASTVEVYRGR